MTRKACIDLGTNTAHLLIADRTNHELIEIFRERHFVFLAENGISHIGKAALKRLDKALQSFKDHCQRNGPEIVRVVATEALRKADNSTVILQSIKNRFGWDVDLITGEEEARFIYQAVNHVIDLKVGNFLIIDVGGGSVEFISSISGEIEMMTSLPIGIGNLYNQFHHSDPLSVRDEANLINHLSEHCYELNEYLQKYNFDFTLVGTAGTFEVFGQALGKKDNICFSVPYESFYDLYENLRWKNEDERLHQSWIPAARARYISVAFVLIDFILKRLKKSHFLVTEYSLKEGIILS